MYKKYISKPTKLLLYSDGILNLKNDLQHHFSLKDLKNLVYTSYKGLSPAQIIVSLEHNIKQIDVEDSLKDDISLLAIEWS